MHVLPLSLLCETGMWGAPLSASSVPVPVSGVVPTLAVGEKG